MRGIKVNHLLGSCRFLDDGTLSGACDCDFPGSARYHGVQAHPPKVLTMDHLLCSCCSLRTTIAKPIYDLHSTAAYDSHCAERLGSRFLSVDSVL